MGKKNIRRDHPLGLYLHIPFCKAKCAYCDFYSLARSEEKMDAYTAALQRHLAEVAPQADCHIVDTVYFGGGTPSYLGVKRLTELLKTVKKHYRLAKEPEITVEANPDSACDWKALRALRRAGVNRLSLGVQSTDDALLQAIGRVHTFAQVQEAVAAARRAKIKNLSLDLIYGLPGQTMAQWEKTLQDAVDLQPEHLSCYGLKLEPGTPLFARQGELTFPDDDAQADMYRDIDRYIAGELVLSERETISRRERDMEYIMLRLRLTRGADPREFENAFRERFNPLAKLLHQYAAHGLACQNDDGSWRLTPKGFLVSNQIIGALQEELSREKADRLARAARGDYRVID